MKRNTIFSALLMLVALSLTLSGCVSKKKYAALQSQYDALAADHSTTTASLADYQGRYNTLNALLEQARAQNATLMQQYNALQNNLDRTLEQNSQGNANIAKLVDEINASNRYIKQLVDAKSKSDSLNIVLTNNLTRSLSRDDMRDVNIRVLKGVVYISLADNMLFRSGSYEVSDRAMEILGKIAKIIKDYNSYDVLVEGNTDNVPISRTNIRNNWDLSALRASSVVQVLQTRFGVDASRLTAAGRGEYNPIADNETADGRERNRRTEIIITPSLDQFMELIDHAPSTDQQ